MSQSPDSNTTTAGIRVKAAAHYIAEESDPDKPFFLFMYRIEIVNEGDREVQLRKRHWIIRDAFNERHDVHGAGVIGEYPILAPGESYEYTSTCPLRTRWGTMEGTYDFEFRDTGAPLRVEIGRFFLVPSSRLKQLSAES